MELGIKLIILILSVDCWANYVSRGVNLLIHFFPAPLIISLLTHTLKSQNSKRQPWYERERGIQLKDSEKEIQTKYRKIYTNLSVYAGQNLLKLKKPAELFQQKKSASTRLPQSKTICSSPQKVQSYRAEQIQSIINLNFQTLYLQ